MPEGLGVMSFGWFERATNSNDKPSYSDLLWLLLIFTLLAVIATLMHQSAGEKAQRLLHKLAKVDMDDESSALAQQRRKLVEHKMLMQSGIVKAVSPSAWRLRHAPEHGNVPYWVHNSTCE